MRTGELARQAGVNIETVRYYERRDLLAEPPRSAGGYRQYGPDALTRVRFIKRAQQLGFTLKEIAELLALQVDPGSCCDDVRERAESKRSEIDGKIASLQELAACLDELIAQCTTATSGESCPILDSLEV